MCALVTGVQTCALPICRPDGGAGLGAYVRALRRLWSDLRNRRGTDVLPGLLRRRRVAVARVFVARAGASRAGTAASRQTLSQPARDRPLTADRWSVPAFGLGRSWPFIADGRHQRTTAGLAVRRTRTSPGPNWPRTRQH